MTERVPIGGCHWNDEGEWVACPACFTAADGGCSSVPGLLRAALEAGDSMLDDAADHVAIVLAALRALPVEQRMEAMGMAGGYCEDARCWREEPESVNGGSGTAHVVFEEFALNPDLSDGSSSAWPPPSFRHSR